MGIFSLILGIGGLAAGYVFKYIQELYDMKKRFPGFLTIMNARKKGKKLLLLETENAFWLGSEKASYQNISITEGRNLVFVAPNSVKPVYALGGVLLGIGDLYRATTIPKELRQTIVFLKLIGFSDSEIKTYLSKIHGIGIVKEDVSSPSAVKQAEDYLVRRLKERIKSIENLIQETNDEKQKKMLENKKQLLELILEKKEIYLTTPSTIVNFLQTGINRVTLKAQLKQIVDEKMLEKLSQTNWIAIGIMILLVLIGLWMLFGGGLGSMISGFFHHSASTTIHPR